MNPCIAEAHYIKLSSIGPVDNLIISKIKEGNNDNL